MVKKINRKAEKDGILLFSRYGKKGTGRKAQTLASRRRTQSRLGASLKFVNRIIRDVSALYEKNFMYKY